MKIKQPYLAENQNESFQKNSDAIKQALGAEEIDFEQLLALVSDRESLVIKHLDSIIQEEKQQFVADELKTNEDLKQIVGALKAEQQSLLVNFLRSRKAIKKYKK